MTDQEPNTDASHLVPIDQWPVVIPLPPDDEQVPDPEADQPIIDMMREHEAARAEGEQYLREVAAATEGMPVDELNTWCFEMERWNDAVHGGPRHAEPYGDET